MSTPGARLLVDGGYTVLTLSRPRYTDALSLVWVRPSEHARAGGKRSVGGRAVRDSRVAEAAERVRVIDAVAGRLHGPAVEGLAAAAAVLADLAGYVRETGDAGGAVGRGRARVSPLAGRRRGEKL